MPTFDDPGYSFDSGSLAFDGSLVARSYDALAIVLGPAMRGATEVDAARYFATTGFCTSLTDTPAQTAFLGRIAEDIEYVREFTCIFWQGQARTGSSIGAVQLINNDRRLDELRNVQIRDRSVSIYRGMLSEPFDAWELCGSAIADRVEFPSLDRCVLVLADKLAMLDRPVQQSLYSGTDNTAIEQQVKPMLIGECLSIPAIAFDLTDLKYDVHDDVPHAILRVRANGVERIPPGVGEEWIEDGNGFQLLTSPEGLMTADAQGAEDGGTLIEYLPDVLNYLLVDRLGLTTADLDTTRIDALDTAAHYKLGYFADRPVTYKQVLAEIMVSFGGGYWVNRLNQISVGRLQAPADPVLTIDQSMLDTDGGFVVDFDRAPGYSNVCAGQRNWRVHQPNEIASILTDPVYTQIASDLQQDYRVRRSGVPSGSGDPLAEFETGPREGANVIGPGDSARINGNTGIGTLLVSATDIQAEATRWVLMFEQRRNFWTLPVLLAPSVALHLEPCQSVTLSLTDGAYGLDTPRDVLVVGVRGRFLSGRVELRLWG